MPLSVGDAVLTFLGDTTELDQVFVRIPEQAEASMSAAAESVDKVGIAAQGVSFELDATASNAAFAGGMIKDSMVGVEEKIRLIKEQMAELAYQESLTGQAAALMGQAFGELGNVLVAALGVEAFKSQIEGAQKSILALELLSEKTGVAINTMAGIEHVSAAAGVAFEQVSTALTKLSRAQILALEGSTAQVAAFRRIGISVEELKTLAPEELFYRVGEAMANASSHGAAAASAFALLGKGGAALIPIFQQNRDELRGMVDEAAKASGVTKDAANSAREWEAQTANLSEAWRSVMIPLMKGSVPVIRAVETAASSVAMVIRDLAAVFGGLGLVFIDQAKAMGAIFDDVIHGNLVKLESDGKQFAETMTHDLLGIGIQFKQEWANTADYIKHVWTDVNPLKPMKDDFSDVVAKQKDLTKKADEEIKKQGAAVAKEAAQEEKAWETAYRAALGYLQDTERQKIATTRGGSQERIAAIDAALKEERSKGLQATQYYKELEREKQRAIEETINVARDNAQKDLREAQTDAKEKLQVLLAGLKEQEAALQANEQKGLITKKQVLVQTEALQKQETTAKIAALKEEAAAAKEALAIEEQALLVALGQITDADQYAKALQRVLDIEKQRDALAKKFASDEHVASIQGQKDLETTEGKLAQLEKSWATYFNQMHRDLPSIGHSIRTELQGSIDTFNKRFSADFAQMLVTGKGFGQAMKSLGQDMAKSFISMLTEMLLKWVETQIAMKILGISSSKQTASAEIAASAALAGANMVASWSLAPWPIDAAAPAMGAVAYADAMAYEGLVALATGGLVTGPTLAMFGEKGDEAVLPLTDPAAMERISNALLSSPTMRLASAGMSDPTAIALASNVKQGGLDDAAMAKLGDIIGAHLDSSGSAGDVTHVHVNIKGSVDHGTIAGLVRKINQGVGNRRLNLNASNSLRVTRRSQ